MLLFTENPIDTLPAMTPERRRLIRQLAKAIDAAASANASSPAAAPKARSGSPRPGRYIDSRLVGERFRVR